MRGASRGPCSGQRNRTSTSYAGLCSTDRTSGPVPGFSATLDHERKQITVLAADIRGSTELIAERSPEDARRLLGSIRERMVQSVKPYGGTIHWLTDDGIVALFGAPLAYEDHALRGCYAALKMQESIKKHPKGDKAGHWNETITLQ